MAEQPGIDNGDTSGADEPKGSLCVVCYSPIHQGAKKCVTCDSYQSPLRSILSGIDLQALITLIPIATLAFVFLRDQLVTPQADLRIASLSCAVDKVTLAAANVGNRDALFAGAYLSHDDGRRLLLNVDMDKSEPLISPGTTRIYKLAVLDKSGSPMGLQLSTERPCEYRITPRSVSLSDAVKHTDTVCACPQ